MPDFDDVPDALDGELDGAPDAAPDDADAAAPDILDADETTDDLAYQLGPDDIPDQAQTDAIFGVMSEAGPDAAAALKSEWNHVRIRSASSFPLATRFATQRGGTSSDRR